MNIPVPSSDVAVPSQMVMMVVVVKMVILVVLMMLVVVMVTVMVMLLNSEHSCPWLRCSCAYSNGDVDDGDVHGGYGDSNGDGIEQ